MRKGVGLILIAAMMAACSPEPAATPEEPGSDEGETGLISRNDADFTAADLTYLINVRGPQDAVLEIFGQPQWDQVIAGIASGDQAWLDTVPLMAEGLDGEAYTVTTDALSQALAVNAAGVLRLTPGQASVEEVCFPDPPYQDPAEETAANVRHAQKVGAVEAIDDPALVEARTECLGWLQPA